MLAVCTLSAINVPLQVDFSVVAPARIERPRYKEIEIPKFRLIDESILSKIASIHPVNAINSK